MSLADALQRLEPTRRAALQRFLDLGWPSRRQEAWRYHDLSPLGAIEWSVAGLPQEPVSQPEPASDDALGWLYRALARPDPVPDVLASGVLSLHTRRETVPAGETRALTEHHGGTVAGFRGMLTELSLAPEASAQWLWIGTAQGSGQDVLRLRLELAAGARARVVLMHLGALDTRLEVEATLAGEGAALELYALAFPLGGRFSLPVTVTHRAPRATSRLALRSIGAGSARLHVHGLVRVAPGAAKTDSSQQLASLLLSRKAEINAKPDLEIEHDDVKCAHGASIGQLDAQALFYLRARGLPEATARRLLIEAFAGAIASAVEDTEAQALLQAALHRRLAELEDAP